VRSGKEKRERDKDKRELGTLFRPAAYLKSTTRFWS
jgi:hypothetical protein